MTPVPNENWKAKEKNKTYAEPAPGDAGAGTGDAGGRNDNDDGINPIGGSDASGAGSVTGDSESKGKTPILPRGSKKGPPAGRADETGGKNSGKAPTISIDEKVAWRSPPVRTRIAVRTHTTHARLVRLPAYPKSEWLPVDSESKVASK